MGGRARFLAALTAVASLTVGFAPPAHAVAFGVCAMNVQLTSRGNGVAFGLTTGPNAVEILMSTSSCTAEFPVAASVVLDATVNTLFGTQFSCLDGIGGVPPFASGAGTLNGVLVNVTLIGVSGGFFVSVGSQSLPLIATGGGALVPTQCLTPHSPITGTGALVFYDPGFLGSMLQQAQSAPS